MGREIVEVEQAGQARAGYGDEVIEQLAAKLSVAYGRGFSVRNLWSMRQFSHVSYWFCGCQDSADSVCRISPGGIRVAIASEVFQVGAYCLAERGQLEVARSGAESIGTVVSPGAGVVALPRTDAGDKGDRALVLRDRGHARILVGAAT